MAMKLTIFVLLLITCGMGCAHGVSREESGVHCRGNLPTNSASQARIRQSAWGMPVTGLRARFEAPARVEQNAPLSLVVELACDPHQLPPGHNRLDVFLAPLHLQLTLRNTASGERIQVQPDDPMHGAPEFDRGQDTVPLDGRKIEPIRATFRLRSARGPQPGDYACFVSYSTEHGSLHYPDGVRPSGCWAGERRTGTLYLTVAPEIVRSRTFVVPRRLRVIKGKVVFLPQDAQRITAAVGNGLFLGTRITPGDGGWLMLQSGTPVPHASHPIDDWTLGAGRPKRPQVTYTIEVFETSTPPQEMWDPSPATADYKTLWRGTFIVPTGRKP